MKWYFKLFIIFILWNCSSPKDTGIPNIEDINISPIYHWTTNDLQIMGLNNFENLDSIINLHPVFYKLYINELIGIRADISASDTNFTEAWSAFISDTSTIFLFHKIDSIYHDHSKLEHEMNQSLKYFHYYFPDRQIPDLYFTNSSLAVANFLFENSAKKESVSIGLDFFLGESFPYLALAGTNPVFSQFMSRNFDKTHIVSRTMMAIIDDIIGPPRGTKMLDLMIHNGKKLYVLKSLIPHEKLNVLMGFSEDEMKWCRDNQRDIWAYFIDEKLFYETTSKRITTYVNPAPNSKGMPAESPGETANFMGYKIVASYMKRNPDMSLNGLMTLTDAQEIMDRSKFKP